MFPYDSTLFFREYGESLHGFDAHKIEIVYDFPYRFCWINLDGLYKGPFFGVRLTIISVI